MIKRPLVYWVYIVECRDGSYYTGITTDVDRRIREHNETALGSAYVRARRPVHLVYKEVVGAITLARKREWRIKQFTKTEKHMLVDQYDRLASRNV